MTASPPLPGPSLRPQRQRPRRRAGWVDRRCDRSTRRVHCGALQLHEQAPVGTVTPASIRATANRTRTMCSWLMSPSDTTRALVRAVVAGAPGAVVIRLRGARQGWLKGRTIAPPLPLEHFAILLAPFAAPGTARQGSDSSADACSGILSGAQNCDERHDGSSRTRVSDTLNRIVDPKRVAVTAPGWRGAQRRAPAARRPCLQ